MVLARVEIKVPPPGVDWRKQPIIAAPMNAKTTVTGGTRPSAHVLAAKHHKLAGTRKAAAERKRKKHAAVENQAQTQGRCRASGSEEAETPPRRGSSARVPATTPPVTTPPVTAPPATAPTCSLLPAYDFGTGGLLDFDVGGLAGQSLASLSDSICPRELARSRVDPVAAFPASSQFFLLPSSPSQNGQVRHWSGRTSYTVQMRLTPGVPSRPRWESPSGTRNRNYPGACGFPSGCNAGRCAGNIFRSPPPAKYSDLSPAGRFLRRKSTRTPARRCSSSRTVSR